MKKYLMYGVIVIAIIFLVVVARPLILGFQSSYDPQGVKQQVQKKVAENADLYLPAGYVLTQSDHQAVVEGNAFYTTKLTKGNSEIVIIKENEKTIECDGVFKMIGNYEVCYSEFTAQDRPVLKRMWWINNGKLFILTVADDSVTNIDIEKLVSSIK